MHSRTFARILTLMKISWPPQGRTLFWFIVVFQDCIEYCYFMMMTFFVHVLYAVYFQQNNVYYAHVACPPHMACYYSCCAILTLYYYKIMLIFYGVKFLLHIFKRKNNHFKSFKFCKNSFVKWKCGLRTNFKDALILGFTG